ncbi:hypothetical protein DICSQDRAFT_129713 [Dichomitus squalens LYAD-421 SS1]|uniref:BTB domain-containing protein n=1 Tax=Dichomitus squalens (strain LYAD-421) TaxID=732165 RepID=R7SPX2_DICSQ|nr:uncharacterized protein DICSQDRAFT_129713 [Dichomitus squalens LYAD-421 SS1]EJF57032.1 hypothetical protein DICSQDRAFT_129713 [Dichomitus squalens LYAD-421 SS1]
MSRTNKRRAEKQDSEAEDVKRIKTDDNSPTEALAPLQEIPQRNRSAEFWYPDGNVVIVIADTAFKLYQARLSRFSAVFARRFDTEDVQALERMDGCTVYPLTGLSVDDFEQFLAVLEDPFKFTSTAPSQETLIPILRASQALECQKARDLAVEKLRALWPHDDPSLPGGRRPWTTAVTVIHASRECAVSELRVRALYELIRDAQFWHAQARKRATIELSDQDIIGLFFARQWLQGAWQECAFTAPSAKGYTGAPEGGCGGAVQRAGCLPGRAAGPTRRAAWLTDIIVTGDFDKGKQDPIGYLQAMVEGTKKRYRDVGWCETCMEERKQAWREAQQKWWGSLSVFFKN